MANELYRFTDPDNASVTLTFDSGIEVVGVPVTYDNRGDCKMLSVPLEASGGAVVTIRAPGYQTLSMRAKFFPNPDGPASLDVDDFHLAPDQTVPPTEPPTPQPDPGPENHADRVQWNYGKGSYNLATKSGCGAFTEAVAADFAAFYFDRGQLWGHIKKTGAQNQFNGHAVDAIQNLYGDANGKWDIIVASVSSSAHPAFNEAGDANPDDFLPVSAVKPPAKK